MKKVGIYSQTYFEDTKVYLLELVNTLESKDLELIFRKEYFDQLIEEGIFQKEEYSTFEDQDCLENLSVLFTLGGDGTILRAVSSIRDSKVPILGINTGRLGFLATVQKSEIQDAVKSWLEGEFFLEQRSLVSIQAQPHVEALDEQNYALNEVTVSRKDTASMMGIQTFINDKFLTNYWADGLIISTPTGSTGYSLSCQGPLIQPDSNAFVINPIAPHNLNARPLVISDTKTISMEIEGRDQDFLLSLDSKIFTVPGETKIQVKKADFYIFLINLKADNFYNTLRQKLLWGEDTRNHK